MLKHKSKNCLLLSIIFAGLFSCGEVPIDRVDYMREMRNFITNSLDGKELYSTDLYPENAPFAMDESGEFYFYRVNNVARSISADSLDLYERPRDLNIYPYYDLRDAVVVINDDFTGDIYRIHNNDTTLAYKFESKLQRFAYFIKMFGDTYQYHGWRFLAYSCLNYSLDGAFTSINGHTFNAKATSASNLPNHRLGSYFIMEDDITKLPLGDSITFKSDWRERLFYRDRSDTIKAFNTVLDEGKNRTGFQVPLATDVFFQLITFDSYIDEESNSFFKVDTMSAEGETLVVESTLVKRGDYVIPFKVDI